MSIFQKLLAKHDIQNQTAKELTEPVSLRIKRSGQVKTTFDRAFYRPGNTHQADLLYLPTDDKGYKYLLVVIDIGSGIMDARPLKVRDGNTVLKEFQDIYKKHKYLNQPKFLHLDNGSEFKSVESYFNSKNVGVHIAATGRHSQVALAERLNQTIGGTIAKLQLNNELVSGESDSNWITYLPDIIKLVNENAKLTKKPLPKQDDSADVKCNGQECELLEIGQLVRPALDYPESIDGKRLHGSFRTGDRRYALKPSKIENILMYPNQPIRYVVEGYTQNTFSKAELLPFTSNKAKLKMTNNLFVVEKLLERKKIKGIVHFLVKWEGYTKKDNTYEPRSELMKTCPELVKDFEKNNK